MGRIHDALRKAAEEREEKRHREVHRDRPELQAVPAREPEAPELEPSAPSEPAAHPEQRGEPLELVLPGEMAAPAYPPKRPRGVSRRPGAAANPYVTASIGRRPQPQVSTTSRGRKGFRRAQKPEPVRRRTHTVDERVVVFHRVKDDRAERFRVLRSNLTSMSPRPQRILITSTQRNEGKSLVVANLAAAFAEKGGPRVLVVDANLRHPELAQLFGVLDAPGVSEYLDGSVPDLGGIIQSTGISGVDVVAAGEAPANPGALWIYHALRTMLAGVPSVYDYIIVDTPAIDDYADASVMAPDADGALVIIKVGDSTRTQVEHAIDVLTASQGRVLGAFATNA